MMKRILVCLLVAIMGFGTFAACDDGGTVDPKAAIEQNAKIVVWDDERSAKFMPHLIEAFKKEYSQYNVSVEYNMKDCGNAPGDLETAGPAGKGADVLAVNHDGLGILTKSQLIFPNDLYADTTKELQSADSIKAGTYGGKLYGYPIGSEAPVMFFNKKLFEGQEAKLDNLTDLLAFSKTRFEATPSGQSIPNYGFNFNTGYGNSFWLYGLFAGYGAYAFGSDNTDPTDIGLNNAGAIEAAKHYRSWYPYHQQGIDASGTQINTMITMFKNRNLAAFYGSPADFNTIISNLEAGQIDKADVGVRKLPKVPGGGEMKPLTTYKMYTVSSYAKFPKAARAFAAFSQSKEMQILRYATTGTLPTNKEAADDATLKYDPVVAASMESLKNTTITPSIPEWNTAYWANMTAAINELLTSPAKTEKEILDKCVADMRIAIDAMAG